MWVTYLVFLDFLEYWKEELRMVPMVRVVLPEHTDSVPHEDNRIV